MLACTRSERIPEFTHLPIHRFAYKRVNHVAILLVNYATFHFHGRSQLPTLDSQFIFQQRDFLYAFILREIRS